MAQATVRIDNTNALGTATMPWAQDVFDNSDNSLAGMWLPGSGWNRTIVSGVETKDYAATLDLTKTGAPALSAKSAAIDPSNYYSNSALVANLASGGTGGTVLNKATWSMSYATTPAQIANNDTLTVNGVVITFKTAGAAGLQQVNIGASGTITFTAVAALINANPALYGGSALCIGTNHLGQIFFFPNALGAAGNALAMGRSLSCTTATISGATPSGGDQPGVTLLAVARTGAGGKFMPIGLWDAGDQMHVSLGFWGQGTGNLTEGVTAYHYNTTGARFNAKVPAEAGVEGSAWVFGAGSFGTGEAWAYRRHAAIGATGIARNSTGTPAALPTATGPLRLGKANGTNGAGQYVNGGDLAIAWVRNRLMSPAEIDADYAAVKANLLADNGISV